MPTRNLQPCWNKLHHRHFLMTLHVRLKKFLGFFRFLEYLERLLLISSCDGLYYTWFPGHFSKHSKCITTEHHWTYTPVFKILCLCGLGKLWVKNTYHLPKILIFCQLSPKHFLQLGSHRGDHIYRLRRRNLIDSNLSPKFCRRNIPTNRTYSKVHYNRFLKNGFLQAYYTIFFLLEATGL